jgi:hypothetical protein
MSVIHSSRALARALATSIFASVLAAVLASGGCTLLVNREGSQCAVDRDCAKFSATAVCVSGGCQLPPAPPVGPDGGTAGSDTRVGPPGCFSGTPATDLDFYNGCTTSEFQVFDNCARLGLCGSAAYDPHTLVPPPTVITGPPTTTPVVLPDVGCYDATARPRVVFMQGSTNFTSFIQAMAPSLSLRGYTIVWQPTSSCAGAGAGGFDMAPGKNEMKNPTTTAQSFASFYDAHGVATACALGNSPGTPEPGVAEITDIGESDVFAASCGTTPTWVPGSADFPGVGHYLGPIQPLVFATPPASTQRVISAEAAHMIFGMGGGDGVTSPWINPAFMWIRSPTTGTNNIISRGIDVPSTQWWGVDKKTAPAMHDALLTVSASDAEKTIGTLSSDAAKDGIHTLFFQAKGQLAGFLPDSSAAAHDKQNVRDGHYAFWGPIHLYTQVAGGQPSPTAAAFVLAFSTPNKALIDASITGGTVPLCAMSVARETEMGPLRKFQPDFQCGCYYESKVRGGTDCKPCAGPADCSTATPACNLGFCETH